MFHGLGKGDLEFRRMCHSVLIPIFASATIDLSNDVGPGLPFAINDPINKYQTQEYSLAEFKFIGKL